MYRFNGEVDIAAALPGVSLVEIYGKNRILIENHKGIAGYEDGKIQVKVDFGCITICGENLQLRNMSKSRLVITGVVSSVSLYERG